MDYTEAEARAFLDAYRPLLEQHRRRKRPALAAGVFVFGLCILGGAMFPAAWGPAFVVAAFACWLLMMKVLGTHPLPPCTACGNLVGAHGAFCPECGGELMRRGVLDAAKCCGCGKALRQGDWRNYRVKRCTHCAVLLDEDGV